MTAERSRTFLLPLQALAGLFIAIAACAYTACSNSESVGNINGGESSPTESAFNVHETADSTTPASEAQQDQPPSITKYIPLDDTEYPYAGIPRIVIETENRREIKDRETEIPARLQIWGEKAPESEIMELTIRGRGNTTWKYYPKKPYTIKFENKQSFLGIAKAKKWVFLANYLDRTLIRNATALEIAKKTSLEWVPSGKFAEVFLNGKFLGNYFICEKIQINQNRLNISEDSYLLEFDKKNDEDYSFQTSVKNLPINIKKPDIPSEEQSAYITAYIDTIECILYGECKNLAIEKYLDLQSFADYLIVYELTENSEPLHPKSVYMYKDSGPIKAGPVWDFDWGTFIDQKKGWCAKRGIWFNALLSQEPFKRALKYSWNQYKIYFMDIPNFIDSLTQYTKKSNERNIKLWPININSEDFPDRDKSYDESIFMMKKAYSRRIDELDSLLNSL